MGYEQNLPTFYGDYIIRRTIGQGGMKLVTLAYHVPTESDVALALLPIHQAADQVRARFQREIQLLRRLQHPNIVNILNSGSHEGFDFFAMPFLDGESLSDRLERARTPIHEARSLMAAICDAVHFAHEQGIIHRDLKPENIQLVGEVPMLIDFGLSRDLSDAAGLTRDGQGLGTRCYVAPEQVLGCPGTVGKTSDVYSLGAVFLEMLIGRWDFSRLFGNRFSFECIASRADFLQEKSLRVQQALLEICRTAMAREPAERFPSALEMSTAINRVCERLIAPSTTPQSSNPQPTPRTNADRFCAAMTNCPQAGQVVAGRYNLVSQIGRGGMGEVWKATARNRPSAVAIKFLPREIWNPTDLKQLRQRFELVVNLSHTNICTVNDLDVDPVAGVFLVMRYIHGLTLAQHCERKKATGSPFTIDEVCQLLQPVAAALDYAHSVGVVHRDIKLENIMLAAPGNQPLIVDFELAEQVRATMTKQVPGVQPIGTLAYLSPEAWQGKNTHPESDQYALGLIAYEMLSGDLPFGRSTKAEVLRQCTLHEKVPFVAMIGAANQVLLKVLSKDPAQRFTSCVEFITTLKNAVDPRQPIIHRIVEKPTDTTHAFARSMATALLIILIASLAIAWFNRSVFRDAWNALASLPDPTSHDISLATDQTFWQGCKQIQAREFSPAIASFTQVLATDERHVDALVFRGLAYRHLNELDRALADFNQALSLEPQYVVALVDRAETLRLMGEAAKAQASSQATSYFSQAVAEFSNALAIDPEVADALLGRAMARMAMDRFAEAIEDLSLSIEVKPDNADAFEERGNAFLKLQNPSQAYADFSKAIALDPNRTHLNQTMTDCQKLVDKH